MTSQQDICHVNPEKRERGVCQQFTQYQVIMIVSSRHYYHHDVIVIDKKI